MMKKYKAIAIISISILFISAFIAWVGGFNFDKRNEDVACWVLVTITIDIILTISYIDFFYKNNNNDSDVL